MDKKAKINVFYNIFLGGSDMALSLKSPVTALSGCGKKRAELLLALGIENIGQCVVFYKDLVRRF